MCVRAAAIKGEAHLMIYHKGVCVCVRMAGSARGKSGALDEVGGGEHELVVVHPAEHMTAPDIHHNLPIQIMWRAIMV